MKQAMLHATGLHISRSTNSHRNATRSEIVPCERLLGVLAVHGDGAFGKIAPQHGGAFVLLVCNASQCLGGLRRALSQVGYFRTCPRQNCSVDHAASVSQPEPASQLAC